jgi:hypothetical protein
LRRRRARRTRIGATHALRDDEKGEGAGGCAPRGPLQSPAAAAGQSFPPPRETSTPSLTLPAATSIIYTRGERSHRRRHEHDRCKPAYDASPHVEGCRHTPQQPSDIGSYGWWPRRSGALLSVNPKGTRVALRRWSNDVDTMAMAARGRGREDGVGFLHACIDDGPGEVLCLDFAAPKPRHPCF